MSEFLRVAEQILLLERKPMRPRELVDFALGKGLFSDRIAGKTPHQTMKSKLSVDVRRRGSASIFVRTGPGLFFLRQLLTTQIVYEAPPLLKPAPQEQALVFPAAALSPQYRFQGIRRNSKRYI